MAATDQPSATDPAARPDTQTTEKPATAQDGGTATGLASKPSDDATGDGASEAAGAAGTEAVTDGDAAARATDQAMADTTQAKPAESETAGAATETATDMDTDDAAPAPETDTVTAGETGTDAATGATSEAAMAAAGVASVESGVETSAASNSADQMAKSGTGESTGEAQTGAMEPDATQPAGTEAEIADAAGTDPAAKDGNTATDTALPADSGAQPADNAAGDVASNAAPSGEPEATAEATAQQGQASMAKSQDQLPSAGNGNDDNGGGETVVAMVPKGVAPAADGTDQNVTEVAKNKPGATSLGALDTTEKTVPAPAADSGAAVQPAMPLVIAEIPRFDVIRVEPTGEAVLAGRGSPGATVEIIANGQVIAEAIAGPSGEWVVVPDRPLPPGANNISARARIGDGPAVESEEKVAIAVPEQPDGGMLIIRNRPNAPSEILVDTTKSPQSPAVAEAVPETLTTPFVIEAVEAEDRAVFVAGAGATGARVRVYADNVFLGETTVGQGDRWLLQEPKALPFGDLTIRADMTDEAGTVVSRAEVPFSRPARMAAVTPPAQTTVEAAPAQSSPAASTGDAGQAMPAASVATADPVATKTDAVKPTTIIIRRGDNLWTIARRTYGRGIRYTTIFEANTDQIRNPHLIFPGQVFMLPDGEDGTAN